MLAVKAQEDHFMLSYPFFRVAVVTVLASLFIAMGAAFTFGQQGGAPAQNQAQETWEGTLDYATLKLRLVLKVAKAGDGSLKATLISLDQGKREFSINSLPYQDSFRHFELPEIEASFTGGGSHDGSEI